MRTLLLIATAIGLAVALAAAPADARTARKYVRMPAPAMPAAAAGAFAAVGAPIAAPGVVRTPDGRLDFDPDPTIREQVLRDSLANQ